MSPIFFFAPDVHILLLEGFALGKSLRQEPWDSYIAAQKEDWRDLTVMVSFSPLDRTHHSH
jgi:hypothetical protein